MKYRIKNLSMTLQANTIEVAFDVEKSPEGSSWSPVRSVAMSLDPSSAEELEKTILDAAKQTREADKKQTAFIDEVTTKLEGKEI
jgi:hypothetical protein